MTENLHLIFEKKTEQILRHKDKKQHTRLKDINDSSFSYHPSTLLRIMINENGKFFITAEKKHIKKGTQSESVHETLFRCSSKCVFYVNHLLLLDTFFLVLCFLM